MRSFPRIIWAIVLAVGIGLNLDAARAGTVNLCGGAAGWQATWAPVYDPFVQVVASDCSQLGNGIVLIQKSAEFIQPPVNGVFPGIPIVFVQNSPNAVPFIVIDDEIITNSTGTDWTDFHMDLAGSATFNPTLTGGGGGPIGWTIAPFTQASFANGNTQLNISGGVVANGTQWFPGDGLTDGQLFINGNPGTAPSTFTLTETPTPEPSTLGLLTLAALAALRRRR